MKKDNDNRLSGWYWEEGKVDSGSEHIKVGYGGYDKPIIAIAMVAPGKGKSFVVEFLLRKDDLEPKKKNLYDKVLRQLDYFLVELNDPNPWTYAIYHCGSTANEFSNIRWAYYPKGSP